MSPESRIRAEAAGAEHPVSVFTAAELGYLNLPGERRLGRLATVGPGGMPHVTPVGWSLSDDETIIEVGGFNLAETKKFRDVARTGVAALVIDDVLPPWRPRGIEIRGRAEARQDHPQSIRIYPQRVISWGLRPGQSLGARDARDVS